MRDERRASGTPPYWDPGTAIWWRYRRPGWQAGDPEEIRPVRVVTDDADRLVVWLAAETPRYCAVLAENGRDIRTVGLQRQFRVARAQGLSRWRGHGILKIQPTGAPWSAWLFRHEDGSPKEWYVNLEAPHERDAHNVYSTDHVLDVVVALDGSVTRKDEDELVEAVAAGMFDPSQAEEFHRVADHVTELAKRWGSPFGDGWEHWRPDPGWTHPELPDDVEPHHVDVTD